MLQPQNRERHLSTTKVKNTHPQVAMDEVCRLTARVCESERIGNIEATAPPCGGRIANIEATAPPCGGLPGAPGIPASPWLSAGHRAMLIALPGEGALATGMSS